MRKLFGVLLLVGMIGVVYVQSSSAEEGNATPPGWPHVISLTVKIENISTPTASYQQAMPAAQIRSGPSWAGVTLSLTLYEWDDDLGDLTLGSYSVELDNNGDALWCLSNPDDPLLKGVWRSDRAEWLPVVRFAQVRAVLWYRTGMVYVVYHDTGYKTFEVEQP